MGKENRDTFGYYRIRSRDRGFATPLSTGLELVVGAKSGVFVSSPKWMTHEGLDDQFMWQYALAWYRGKLVSEYHFLGDQPWPCEFGPYTPASEFQYMKFEDELGVSWDEMDGNG